MLKYLGLVCSIVGLDGVIKHYIDKEEDKKKVTFGKCEITRCRNKGAMYSIGEKYPKQVRYLSVAVLAGVVFGWLKATVGRKKNIIEKIGMSFLLGGSISNVWDRFKRKYVVDYIHLDVKYIRNIIFNLSDVCIVLGGCITLLVNALRYIREK